MSGSDVDEDNIPDRETCQSLCEEFVTLTGTDEACAQFYLQDRNWDLQRSVNAYYDARGSDEVQVSTDTNEPEVIIPVRCLAAAIAAATPEPEQPPRLKIVSWNVDGLDELNFKRRTKCVCNTINFELPDVVFLQEVLPESLEYLKKHLPAYKTIPSGSEHYFTVTFLRTNSVKYEEHVVIEFPHSRMMRNLLIVKGKIGVIPITLVNTHLESTKEHSSERVNQLKTAFKYVLNVNSDRTVFFGGDLNLRDKELEQTGGIPAGIEDLWISCGSRPECSYTWDMTRNDNNMFPSRFKPRCRFDRIYVRHSSPGKLMPVHFGLIGLERLKSCRRFPSDHWGLVVYLEVK